MSKEYKKISKFSSEIKQIKAILDLREAKEVKAANKIPKKMVRYIPSSLKEPIPILQEFSSTIYMDYEALVHYRVKHSKNEFANNHINDIQII